MHLTASILLLQLLQSLNRLAPAACFTTMLKSCFQMTASRKQLLSVKNYVMLANNWKIVKNEFNID